MIIRRLKDLSWSFNRLYEEARDLLQHGPIIINISMYTPNRSKDQNDYYHRMCGEISDFLISSGLDGFTKERVHDINKREFNVESTKDLSREDFCDYITKVTSFWQEQTDNFWIPSENPKVYLKRRGYY